MIKNKTKLQEKVEKYLNTKKEEDFNEIYKHFEKKFDYTASLWKNDKTNIIGELNLCLANAIKKYDVSQGVQFNTFFWTCWKNQAGTIKIRKNAKKRGQGQEVLSLNTKINNDTEEEHISQLKDKKDLIKESNRTIAFKQMIESIEKQMTFKEKQILELYWKHLTIKDVAEELGCTPSNVCVMLKRIGKKNYAKKIYQFLKEG
jgi:RNA polymerase sigma factor (sigma-70 family)